MPLYHDVVPAELTVVGLMRRVNDQISNPALFPVDESEFIMAAARVLCTCVCVCVCGWGVCCASEAPSCQSVPSLSVVFLQRLGFPATSCLR